MTYGPGPGASNPYPPPQPTYGPPPPHGQGQGWGPPPPEPPSGHWVASSPPPPSGPGRPRRLGLWVAIGVVVLVAAVILTVVLTSNGDKHTALVGGHELSTAPGPASVSVTQPQPTAGNAPGKSGGAARPLPPPTPTGKPYADSDPAVGACADLSRKPTGISIFEADCSDPAAMLILESVQPKNGDCPGKGYFGLDALSDQLLCFTYNLATGDCIDMSIPRRTSCDDITGPAPAPTPKRTVVDVRVGQRDGTGCPHPELYFQIGKSDQRGVACLESMAGNASSAPPSR